MINIDGRLTKGNSYKIISLFSNSTFQVSISIICDNGKTSRVSSNVFIPEQNKRNRIINDLIHD